MIYRALPQFVDSLLKLPESGIGYQFIEARRPMSSKFETFIVYNSDLIVNLDETYQSNKGKILLEGYKSILSKSETIELKDPALVKNPTTKRFQTLSEIKNNNFGRHFGSIGAIEASLESSTGFDTVVRLSAYENDKRIDFENKRLIEGSFATTEADFNKCRNYKDKPVDRYALPNDEAIKWAFFINPKFGDKFRRGVVQPANNHEGGGIEVFFDFGTSVNTYIKKEPF